MKHLLHRRPSASMVVALIALFVAASGTAVAATKLINGDSLIKKGTLSGNRLRKHTLTGAQIKLSKLGTVPSARHAMSATNATNAMNATNATNATTATHATSADSASYAVNATNATNATDATNATNATNATTAANLTGLTRFNKTIQPAGTSAATAAVVTLGSSGPISLVGKCYTSSSGATTGGLYLTTTANAYYNAYYGASSSPLVPGTDQDVGYSDASSTAPAVDFEGPYDGTFAAITDTGSNYITGLASVATNLTGSAGCTFAGYTSAS